MTITILTKIDFGQFLQQRPDDGIYELVNGEIIQVEAIRAHKNVARYLVFGFNDEIRRLQLDYIVDKDIVIRTVTNRGDQRGRNPDVSVVSASSWNSNVTTYGALIEPIQLAVEVTSTNWEDDYIDKLEEYENLGIKEYWIVDYLAIASRSYLGNPKLPTVFVYELVDGKYQIKAFTGTDKIISPTFPELNITVEDVINASQIYNL
ncbi:Uma2 family endonuclease [Dolichospermum sp. ST_con]|nr:Uma2 family endonuclease [Dolichospermum sp. ST_con]MDD1418953.1 Uma2 family endonuclease [Dolichospermum sp. ST_sed1]MDD1424716.1 Uma2 family endonuclease [Dolichospermum sp. ST_sed9]MDD1431164.1 Uma2 family endonuclease [Dolichospermum sp. ST_sed6]MDD1435746.1 Uma2 family endonuclease [Dolichospermum sp. ST_sed10]MDD1440609.1 Uma2 family endonuclease [Dolichospermum sp. ST_sed3]MDD1446525.1 Uma2 family endonuclease [Dolichospermum sp. ST_sed8]MDD1454611.1 Uma2 family endonuclease [Dolic